VGTQGYPCLTEAILQYCRPIIVAVDNGYVQLMNLLAPGSRDMFDANSKAIDYLFRALCQPEFDRVHTEHLACRIWSVLKEAHVGNARFRLGCI
jgi:hypothetical protein